ncbi:GAP family protein [Leifsonia sp. ZF2019]|uniref:GAP family protein n=1 Tax=Leifsonia sp. ZF2019 TaxID=2781978 RepID=UPI001CC1A32B|nr:GAP family protein [Leifsonia sp. ZF2019]UAJ79211.1 GAP family protein [Leifsonia sp. ZF2019]
MTTALLPVIAEAPLALGIALSPLPLVAGVVIPLSPHGAGRGFALLAGRLAGVLAVVGAVTALAEYLAEIGGGAASTGIGWARLLLGVVLVVLGVVKWTKRPHGDDAETPPRWMASLESLSGSRALGLGFVLSVANPKELAFGGGAGLVIGSSLTGWGPSVIAVAVFAALACVTVALPPAAVLIGGERSTPALGEVRGWLIRNTATISAIVLLFFGAILIGNAFD